MTAVENITISIVKKGLNPALFIAIDVSSMEWVTVFANQTQ